jgi:hypothetical protein
MRSAPRRLHGFHPRRTSCTVVDPRGGGRAAMGVPCAWIRVAAYEGKGATPPSCCIHRGRRQLEPGHAVARGQPSRVPCIRRWCGWGSVTACRGRGRGPPGVVVGQGRCGCSLGSPPREYKRASTIECMARFRGRKLLHAANRHRRYLRDYFTLLALIDLYIHPIYVLVSKILSSILNSSAPIHPLYHPLSTLFTVGHTCHFI